MASSAKLDIIVSLINEASGELKTLQKDLKGVEDTGEKASTSFGDVSKALGAVGIAAAATGVVLKKSFDFAEMGAGVEQMRESFAGLGVDFDALKAASGGTVDEMTLMSSTAKLLAGTTGTLNARMTEAAPQLLEVARAAVKLDPTIGTVAQTYESLSAGIKRNQPKLIDNANIMVQVGTANEKLANSLGKTVDELTDEERAVALLNETLRAGGEIIQQVGGTVDSQTDKYQRLGAALQDLKADAGVLADRVGGPFVEALADGADAVGKANDVLGNNKALLQLIAGDYGGLMVTLQEAGGVVENEAEAIKKGTDAIAQGFSDVGASAPQAATGTFSAATAVDQYNAAIAGQDSAAMAALVAHNWAISESAGAAAIANMDFASSLGEMSKAQFAQSQLKILDEAMLAAGKSTEETAEAHRALMIEMGLLTPAEEKAAEVMGDFAGRLADGKGTVDDYATGLSNLHGYLTSLPSEKTIDINVNTHYSTYGNPANSGASGGYVDPGTGSGYANAAGGFIPMGSSGIVGDGGRAEVAIATPAGVRIVPTTTQTYNINNTFQSGTNPNQVVGMQMALYGGG